MKTLTIRDLKKFFNTLPDDMRVYLSSDEEGNNYSTTSLAFGTEVFNKDNSLIIYPSEYVDITDIAPQQYNEEEV